MRSYRTARIGLVGLLAAAAVVVPGSAAHASGTGCPPPYEVLDVSDLFDAGYRVPTEMDEVRGSFGQPPNHNDAVCAKRIGSQTTPSGLPLYNFLDDSFPG